MVSMLGSLTFLENLTEKEGSYTKEGGRIFTQFYQRSKSYLKLMSGSYARKFTIHSCLNQIYNMCEKYIKTKKSNIDNTTLFIRTFFKERKKGKFFIHQFFSSNFFDNFVSTFFLLYNFPFNVYDCTY